MRRRRCHADVGRRRDERHVANYALQDLPVACANTGQFAGHTERHGRAPARDHQELIVAQQLDQFGRARQLWHALIRAP